MGYSYTFLRPAQVPDKIEPGVHAGPRLWTKLVSGWVETLKQQRGQMLGLPSPLLIMAKSSYEQIILSLGPQCLP